MTLINLTDDVMLTYDESAGLQNATATPAPPGPTGDANDNDIAVSALPSAFSGRLSTLTLGASPLGAALSGYDGINTGLNIYTLTPDPTGTITDIAFTDNSGAALSGQDSGVQTLNGNHVFLYTDSVNNNIVLGRAGTGSTPNPNGAIVFAAYIDESATGGKVWTAHYQQIKHSGGADSDVSVSLAGALSIAATQDLSFSLENAPSGQNLFLMFTTANPTIETVGGIARIVGPSIIATGKDPANQSTGVNITTGDTINTSQAGGPTTFGTNNQMIVEQEGIRFTFVTGARQDVTIPNLDQNEADIESNIDFTGMFNARSATFDVVQLQSGKSAQVKISALNTAKESGTAFIDGYAGDASVAISNVVVKNSTGTVIENSDGSVNDPSINITFSSGVATITGIKAGYNISYTTNGDHNRVLVENGAAVDAKGTNHADFDIGGFKLLQVSKDALSIGARVSIEDDGPAIAEGIPPSLDEVLQVDETNLATNASADFSTELAPASITPGTDGTKSTSSVYSLGISLTGADSGLVDTATNHSVFLFLNSGVVEGREGTDAVAAASGAIVFTVSVNSGTGVVTLDQQRAIVHPDTANPDDVKTLSAANLIVLSRADTVTDGDGNTASSSTSTNIGQAFEFKDDGPSISTNAAVQLDDDALAGGNAGGTGDDADSVNTSGTLGHSFGADGAGTVAYLTSGAPSGFTYELSGSDLLIKQDTTTVMTLTLNSATGAYTVVQNAPIMHVPGSDENNQAFTVNYRVTDKDGDTADGTLSINVDDDTPVVSTSPVQDTNPILGAALWTFTGAFAYSVGADKHGPIYSATNSDFAELSLSGTVNDESIGSPVVSWAAENDSSATFDVSFTYDQDRDPATAPVPVTGTLEFDKVNDTYTFVFDALAAKVDVTLGNGTGYETYNVNGTTPSSGPSPVATGKLGDGFYIQFTGFESPLSAGGNTTLTSGELVSGTQAPVTLSSTALGVSGNTIQSGEAANINFFATDPKGNLGATNYTYASDFFIKFDGFETESDDLILVLNLADADNPALTTTRAIYVDQQDVYENDTNNTDLAGTKYVSIVSTLDNNDALLIVEGNDYNINPGDNWVLRGLQILSNDAGLTGSAINLNRNVGDDGGSSTTASPISGLVGPGNTIQEDDSTNPIKIIDAGFSSVSTVPPSLDLQMNFKVGDKDGDYTGTQSIDFDVPVVGLTSLLTTDIGI